ncbi:MAG: transglycosylase SLT domain-containing protein [Cyanobium sp.]
MPQGSVRPLLIALAGGTLLLAAGLGGRLALSPGGVADAEPLQAEFQKPDAAPAPLAVLPDTRTISVALPSDPSLPTSADGRHYPLLPPDPAAIASLLAAVEEAVRTPATAAEDRPALGHQQQVIYRVLAHRRALADQVRLSLPQRWRPVFDHHVAARREFIAMHPLHRRPTQLPAWRILEPEPPENLLRYYREAAAATGIPWEVLAAVNLVESGMGRIDGVSVADAHGPMQFLPSTWAEPGIGNGGDIRDPRTAIHAAARYLVRRGGLKDIRKGLWGYNNSDNYGRGVLHYAAILQDDPSAYLGLYHWQIHYAAAGGDLWLPVGYVQSRPIPVASWLRLSPVSQPPPGSSGY